MLFHLTKPLLKCQSNFCLFSSLLARDFKSIGYYLKSWLLRRFLNLVNILHGPAPLFALNVHRRIYVKIKCESFVFLKVSRSVNHNRARSFKLTREYVRFIREHFKCARSYSAAYKAILFCDFQKTKVSLDSTCTLSRNESYSYWAPFCSCQSPILLSCHPECQIAHT